MKMKPFVSGLTVVLILAFATVSANAVVITWDFRTGQTSGSESGSGYGNVWTFTQGGYAVTVTSWALTGSSQTTLQTANTVRASNGLGVCNQYEGTGSSCSSDERHVDNIDRYDFVLFQWAVPFDPLSIIIDPSSDEDEDDRDVSYWTGTATNPLNLNGYTIANLNTLFGTVTNSDNSSGSSNLEITLTSGYVNSLLFASRHYPSSPDRDDAFYIRSLTADYQPDLPPQGPEPSSILLMGLGLTGLGLAARRRRS